MNDLAKATTLYWEVCQMWNNSASKPVDMTVGDAFKKLLEADRIRRGRYIKLGQQIETLRMAIVRRQDDRTPKYPQKILALPIK